MNPIDSPEVSAAATHIVVLLDRSGSMESIADDVIGGFNKLIADQKRDGNDAIVTLVQFDTQQPEDVIYENLPIADVPPLTRNTFVPRGGTPLLDATGRLVSRLRGQMRADSRPGDQQPHIVFVTITDGQENESREFSLIKVRELVANCEQEGWTFAYLSADIHAYEDADAMGVQAGNTRAFRPTKAGAEAAFSVLSTTMTDFRDKKRRGVDTAADDFFDVSKVDRLLGDETD